MCNIVYIILLRQPCSIIFAMNADGVSEAASPVRLVRPRPDHFSAGRWSRSQTAETVWGRDNWARCPTQVCLCHVSAVCTLYMFLVIVPALLPAYQEPGTARPDCIRTHAFTTAAAPPSCTCTSDLYLQWPDHFWNAGTASVSKIDILNTWYHHRGNMVFSFLIETC